MNPAKIRTHTVPYTAMRLAGNILNYMLTTVFRLRSCKDQSQFIGHTGPLVAINGMILVYVVMPALQQLYTVATYTKSWTLVIMHVEQRIMRGLLCMNKQITSIYVIVTVFLVRQKSEYGKGVWFIVFEILMTEVSTILHLNNYLIFQSAINQSLFDYQKHLGILQY